MPDPVNLPRGCKFHTRCNYAGESCAAAAPALIDTGAEHLVRCVYALDGLPASGEPAEEAQ
jgi:oligopeptide/dipeptide ABC transporter ATP-binding protein